MSKRNDRPVGLAEIAELLGAIPKTVWVWKGRGLLPAPDWPTATEPGHINGKPVWWRSTIEKWARESNRLPS